MTAACIKRSCLGLAVLMASALLAPGAANADFALKRASTSIVNGDGSVDLQAGSRPYEYSVDFGLNVDSNEAAEGELQDVIVELPTGLVGNPLAVPQCDQSELTGFISRCPGRTQVGVAEFEFREEKANYPIFNLSAPLGAPARLGFSVDGYSAFEDASLRSSDYGVNVADILVPPIGLTAITERIWGVPADPSHDSERVCANGVSGVQPGELICPTEAPRSPFLSLPTSCDGPLRTVIQVDSRENPGVFDSRTVYPVNDVGIAAGLEGCGALPFGPSLSAVPETAAADSPTGLDVGIGIPQNQDPDGLAAAHLRDVVVTLPSGLVVNPSAGAGLVGCPLEGPEGINLPKSTDPDVPEPALVAEAAKCPGAAQVGTVSVDTPLLDHPVPGDVYIARQGEIRSAR